MSTQWIGYEIEIICDWHMLHMSSTIFVNILARFAQLFSKNGLTSQFFEIWKTKWNVTQYSIIKRRLEVKILSCYDQNKNYHKYTNQFHFGWVNSHQTSIWPYRYFIFVKFAPNFSSIISTYLWIMVITTYNSTICRYFYKQHKCWFSKLVFPNLHQHDFFKMCWY